MTEVEAELEDLRGAFVPATVTQIEEAHVAVSLPGDAEGIIPRADIVGPGQTELDLEVGQSLTVYVEQESGARYLVSKDKADRMAALDRVGELKEKGELVEGEVVSASNSGFVVDIGVRAFCPGSQFALRPVQNPDEVLGQTFSFKIARFQKARQNVVLSRRALLEKERDQALRRLKVGTLVEGTVRRFTDYGAFVDIGGLDGLLHVSDMSWGRINKPSEVVAIGDRLTLKVLRFDKKNRRVSLGLRQCQDDPWLTVPDKYEVGKVVTGLVVSKTDFGAFIEMEPGVEGLVHSTGPIVTDTAKKVLDKTDVGDELSAKVVDVDAHQKRMSLALVEDE